MLPVAVIIDAYGAGNNYPESFKARGVNCIHIQTSKKLLPVFEKSLRDDGYLEKLAFDGDLDPLLNALKKYDVKCVIPGVEPGVELADKLSEMLGLRTNGFALSFARRNKYAMAEAIKAAGLPTPSFCKIASWDELMNWKEREKIEYPIVLKPLNSGASDGVCICQNEKELEASFQNLIGKKNILGFFNKELLAQSFLVGQEYIVNSVSLDGKCYVVAILKSKKSLLQGFGFIYDREKMMKYDGIKQRSLVAMHEKVLKALNINHGASHGEYMFTKEGPVLIEVGARISGGVNPKSNQLSVAVNQIDLNVDAYIDQEAFAQKTQEHYRRTKHFYQVLLTTSKSGVVRDIDSFVQNCMKLPSFCDIKLKVVQEQQISKTIDLISTLGNIFLVHEKKEIIESDYQEVLRLTSTLVG